MILSTQESLWLNPQNLQVVNELHVQDWSGDEVNVNHSLKGKANAGDRIQTKNITM